MQPCFKFKPRAAATASAAAANPLLSIYDEIGFWGVQASDFRAALAAVEGDELDVEISSPGGDVFAGVAIYNMLRSSGKKINMKVMGVAASAASLIAMAGDTRIMPKNTFMMVHNPWAIAMGNAADMRETVEMLEKIGASMHATYKARTGMDDDALTAMLAKDTWLTADEALAAGFATEVTPEIKAKAEFDMTRADLPAHVRAVYASATPPVAKTPEEIAAEQEAEEKRVAALAAADLAAGMPVATAVHALAVKAGLTDHADYLAVAANTVDEGTTLVKRATDIVALANIAKRPAAEVKAYVKGTQTVSEVRAAIVKAMADEDVHTNTTKPVNPNTPVAGVKPASDVHAARAARKAARKA